MRDDPNNGCEGDYKEVEDYNKDPCVRLFFAGCFLLLPREKEKPDTQAMLDVSLIHFVVSLLSQLNISWAWLTNAAMPQPLSVFGCVVKAKSAECVMTSS